MRFRTTALAALVAPMMLLAGSNSRAAFTYSTSQAPSGVVAGGTTVALTGVTSVTPQNGTTIINAVNVAIATTTAPPATDMFSLTFTDTVTINTVGDGTVTLRVNQTLIFSRADTGGEVSTDTLNVAASSLTASDAGFSYSISALQYAGPTVDNTGAGNGNISYIITETPSTIVPGPPSAGMLALGLGFAGFVGFRRSRLRAA